MVYSITVEYWNGHKSSMFVQIPDDAVDIESACREALKTANKRREKRGFDTPTFVRVVEKAAFQGLDGYGQYWDFSGHEAKGQCFWCGAEIKRGRYCTTEHRDEYLSHYNWAFARDRCIESSAVARKAKQYYDYTHINLTVRCFDCGLEKEYNSGEFEVHHVVPVDGEDRNWHWLNRPENLVLLCKPCHTQRHVDLNYLLKKAEVVEIETERQVGKEERQLTLWEAFDGK